MTSAVQHFGYQGTQPGHSARFSASGLRLLFLFAVYGPSFSFAGQLRYVEAILILWSALHIKRLMKEMKGFNAILIYLFLISGLMQLVSGLIHGSPGSAIIARAGTYVILAILLLAVQGMIRGNMKWLIYILAGYCLSYIFILLTGTGVSRNYQTVPWRLGLGFAAMIALALVFAVKPRWQRLAPLAFITLAGVHIMMSSRSLAVVAIAVAGVTFLAQLRRRQHPRDFRFLITVGAVAMIGFIGWSGPKVLLSLAENGWLTEEMTRKTLSQASVSSGFWAAARPDTVTAIYAIGQRPLLGFGPGVVDPQIYSFYARISAEALAGGNERDADAIFQSRQGNEWSLGTPSHSHLFGAWADAGLLAMLCWLAVLGLAIYILVRTSGFRHPLTPLYALMALSTIWDVLFSPGPHRMDIALRIAVLVFAMRHFQFIDAQHGIMKQLQVTSKKFVRS